MKVSWLSLAVKQNTFWVQRTTSRFIYLVGLNLEVSLNQRSKWAVSLKMCVWLGLSAYRCRQKGSRGAAGSTSEGEWGSTEAAGGTATPLCKPVV